MCSSDLVSRQLPHLGDNGKNVNRPQLREPGVGDYHPMTMPELRRWFAFLSARLRHVRILHGDWTRAVTGGAAFTLPVRQGGACGVFLDPPYADTAGRAELYSHDDDQVAHAVRAWCLEHGDDKRLRIVLAGYEGEHGDALERAGWRVVEWFRAGFLKGGMAQQRQRADDDGGTTHQQHRERLYLSPQCLGAVAERQVSLFGGAP